MADNEEVQARIRRILEGKENPIPPVDKNDIQSVLRGIIIGDLESIPQHVSRNGNKFHKVKNHVRRKPSGL
jgi:hypothetical protein